MGQYHKVDPLPRPWPTPSHPTLPYSTLPYPNLHYPTIPYLPTLPYPEVNSCILILCRQWVGSIQVHPQPSPAYYCTTHHDLPDCSLVFSSTQWVGLGQLQFIPSLLPYNLSCCRHFLCKISIVTALARARPITYHSCTRYTISRAARRSKPLRCRF